MNSKITRRVVLGTVISSLAAGPFIIRALRRPTHLPKGDKVKFWEQSWNEAADIVFPDIKSMNYSSGIECQLKPNVGQLSHYAILIPVYKNVPNNKKDIPDGFMIKKGTFVPKLINGKIIVSGKDTDVLMVSQQSSEQLASKVFWNCQVQNNKFVPVLLEKGNVSQVNLKKNISEILPMIPYLSFGIDIPSQKLSLNDSWQAEEPLGSYFLGHVTRQVSGVFEIDKHQVVKISTRQNTSFENVSIFLQDILSQIEDKTLQAQLKKEIVDMKQKKIRSSLIADFYFDMETGLLVYGEYSKKLVSDAKSTETQLVHETTFIRLI
jgi:hypothetical protein